MLAELAQQNIRSLRPRADLIHEGDRPQFVHLIISGWAVRYDTLEDGRRQITAILLPGDMCDLNASVLRATDHSIASLTAVTIAELSHRVFDRLASHHPGIMKALWAQTLVNAAIQREWTVSLGRRTALERLSHLVCELFLRLRSVGLTNGNGFEMPLTQTDLADALGITSVHVNRTLQEMRSLGLIRWEGRNFGVLDFDRLCDVGLFDPGYLHLAQDGEHLDGND